MPVRAAAGGSLQRLVASTEELDGGAVQGEVDVVGELFELSYEPAGLSLWVTSTLEVVVTEVVVALAGAEQVPDQIAQAVGYGYCGFVGASPFGDLTVLRTEVASLVRAAARAASTRARRSQGLPGLTPTRRCLPPDS